MFVDELQAAQNDLEGELRDSGPIDFVRGLRSRCAGGQLLARDAQMLPGNRRATRFLYVDPRGEEVIVTIFSEILPDGTPSYSLVVEPREAA